MLLHTNELAGAHSDFGCWTSGMLFCSGIFLFYTAMVSPVQIFMWNYTDECNKFPTLYFDVLVDFFFLVWISPYIICCWPWSEFLAWFGGIEVNRTSHASYVVLLNLCLQCEVLLQFFTGSLDASDRYCDDIRVIAFKYSTSLTGFWFDFVTSLPWSFNDLYSYLVILEAPYQ